MREAAAARYALCMGARDPSRDDPLLRVELAGLTLRNPVLLAAGTAGYVDELADALDLSRVGGVVTKSITAEERAGNATWRVVETCSGMLNAIGLANVGAQRFEREHAPRVERAPCAVLGSIAGHRVEEFVEVARMFERVRAIEAVEVNVSCPNIEGGTQFGDTAQGITEVIAAVREALLTTRLVVKLPPATTTAAGASIEDLAAAAVDAGADALTIANTIPAMAIDPCTRKPRLANTTGGLSGPAVHPVALRLVRLARQAVGEPRGVPIIAAGGALTWRDVASFILAGASAVEMGTALFVDPRAPARAVKGLARWVREQGALSVAELVGALELGGEDS